MPQYVYPSTPSTSAYAVLTSGRVGSLTSGTYLMPLEYMPISLSVSESAKDNLFVYPKIQATYSAMVDLAIDAEWPIVDAQMRVLYVGIVESREFDPHSGTIDYTFGTAAKKLDILCPPGLLKSAQEAIGSEYFNADELFDYLIAHCRQVWPQLTVAPERPSLQIKTGSGAWISPTMPFVSILQPGGTDNLTIGDILSEYFACFPGFRFYMLGSTMHVIPPRELQTPLAALTTSQIYYGTVHEREDGNNVVNSQTVTAQPLVLKEGAFLTAGTPPEPIADDSLAEIAQPSYFVRADDGAGGQTLAEYAPAPENAVNVGMYGVVPFHYSDEIFPVPKEKVRVRLQGRIYAILANPDGSHTVGDYSDSIVHPVHIVDLPKDQTMSKFEFKAEVKDQFGFVTLAAVAFTWALTYKAGKIVIAPVYPVGNVKQEIPVLYAPNSTSPTLTATAVGVFTLKVLGPAWVRGAMNFAATYGKYWPPTMPEGFVSPPITTAGNDDADVQASFLNRGLKAGQELNINRWLIVPPESSLEQIIDSIRGVDDDMTRVTNPLLDIAQGIVREKLQTPMEVSFETVGSCHINNTHIGRLVPLPDGRLGTLEECSLQLDASERVQRLAFDVRDDSAAADNTQTYTPPTPTEYTPPNYPEGGFTGAEPVSVPSLTFAAGSHTLDLSALGLAWVDVLSGDFAAAGRVRIYESQAAHDADVARARTKTISAGGTSYASGTLMDIADSVRTELSLEYYAAAAGRYSFDDAEIDLDASRCWLHVEGGTVTLELLANGRILQGG